MRNPGLVTGSITSVEAGSPTDEIDELSIDEPMEIQLVFLLEDGKCQSSVAVTMRSPGHDIEMAVEFLFTAGIIRGRSDLPNIQTIAPNVVLATINPLTKLDTSTLDRQSFISSSCGVCGRRSVAAVFATKRHQIPRGIPQIKSTTINRLPLAQRESQDNFRRTGGIHASAPYRAWP